ncbi:hypothetical protein N656DRAFT_797577 [Canariomyces notabilis]|uniref:Uncharacterized protein n=1 Tax=Canariomyces notabilis TaxID=2074819 RepID=A0AAN6YTZ1_9PEZI|nr:hypothetical protein N656DRAFT_797577 [Canariomyces arenarius]
MPDNLVEGYWGYYSPGICPSGYVISAIHTTTVPSYYEAPLKPSETLAFCVPSSWTLAKHTKSGYVRSAFVFTGTGIASAPAFPIRWAESDLSRLETHPLSATLTNTDPGLQLTTRTSFAGSTQPTDNAEQVGDASQVGGSGQQGLPGGAIAGIVVGIILALFVGVAIGLFIRRRSRRLAKRTPEATPSDEHPHPPYGASELPEQFIGTRHELEQGQPVTVFELHTPAKDSMMKSVVLGGDVRDQNDGLDGAPTIITTATAQVTETAQTPEPEVNVQQKSENLKERQRKLQERRQRLLELERIEQEEEEIRKKLSQVRN